MGVGVVTTEPLSSSEVYLLIEMMKAPITITDDSRGNQTRTTVYVVDVYVLCIKAFYLE